MADEQSTPARPRFTPSRLHADSPRMRGRPVRRGLPASASAPLPAPLSAPALDRDTLSAAVTLVDTVWTTLGQPADPLLMAYRAALKATLTGQDTLDWPTRYADLTRSFTRHLDTGQALAEVAGFWRAAAQSSVIALEPHADTDVRARYALQQLRQAEDEWQVRVKRRRVEKRLLQVKAKPLRLVLAAGR